MNMNSDEGMVKTLGVGEIVENVERGRDVAVPGKQFQNSRVGWLVSGIDDLHVNCPSSPLNKRKPFL